MMKISLCFAPAKINVFLHILGRKPNGYHELQTLFQLLDFGDTLSFEILPTPQIELIVENRPELANEQNLVFRAAKLLQETFHIQQGVKIILTKKIPMGAGLGGGSSDAGATLRTLNELWEIHAPLEKLLTLGGQLGADVPLFVLNQNAWGEGIGDALTPVELPQQWYVILNPGVHVSSQALYAHAELPRDTAKISLSKHLGKTGPAAAAPRRASRSKDFASASPVFATSSLKNDFEKLVCKLYPEIEKARAWLKQFGETRLTGSGGCLFVPIDSKTAGEAIAAKAPKDWDVIVCQSLSKPHWEVIHFAQTFYQKYGYTPIQRLIVKEMQSRHPNFLSTDLQNLFPGGPKKICELAGLPVPQRCV